MPTPKYKRKGSCLLCGNCCKELKIKIKYRIPGDQAQYLRTRGAEVAWHPSFTVVTFANLPCPHLTQGGKCRLRGTAERPVFCDTAPEKKWQLAEGCGYRFEEVRE